MQKQMGKMFPTLQHFCSQVQGQSAALCHQAGGRGADIFRPFFLPCTL